MSKEKQIEEMIDALKKCSCVYTDCEQECAQCSNEELYDDTLNHIARTLHEEGYREQSEVARDILADVERIILDNTYPHFRKDGKPCIIWKPKEGYDALAELKKKYTEGEA